jgi:hypothetical protein
MTRATPAWPAKRMARSNCVLREALVLRSSRQFPPEFWRELPFGRCVSEIDKLIRPEGEPLLKEREIVSRHISISSDGVLG